MIHSIKPIVWTIAGSDSSGGAGIQADLHAFQALGTYGCSVITALTAQNSYSVQQIALTSPDMVTAQLNALVEDLPPRALKTGMLGDQVIMETLLPILNEVDCPIICDPVMVSTSRAPLLKFSAIDFFVRHMIPFATLITPNIAEAELLTGKTIKEDADIISAAQQLISMGAKSVLIKGGHSHSQYARDYWTDGGNSFWIQSEKITDHNHTHGSGCSLSAAITACLGLGYDLNDALIIAKTYVHQGIRHAEAYGHGPGPVQHSCWPLFAEDFPIVITEDLIETLSFPDIGQTPIGFYPIVADTTLLADLLKTGVNTIQLRIKNKTGSELENEIRKGIEIAKQYEARLFINDYWELALQYSAYGVHLGQEDLSKADLHTLSQANIRLGVSTHGYWEVARVCSVKPSYIAFGPIYETTSKPMKYRSQGLLELYQIRNLISRPLVAIGGINLEKLPSILKTKVDGVAVISAITQAKDPIGAAREWLKLFGN